VDRKRGLQILTAVGGGFIAVAVLFVALLVAKASGMFSSSPVSTPYGWLIPLSAGLVIFGVAWALSSQPRHTPRPMPGLRAVPCARCGKTVMGEWRLCPYCGTLLGAESVDAGTQPQGSTAG